MDWIEYWNQYHPNKYETAVTEWIIKLEHDRDLNIESYDNYYMNLMSLYEKINLEFHNSLLCDINYCIFTIFLLSRYPSSYLDFYLVLSKDLFHSTECMNNLGSIITISIESSNDVLLDRFLQFVYLYTEASISLKIDPCPVLEHFLTKIELGISIQSYISLIHVQYYKCILLFKSFSHRLPFHATNIYHVFILPRSLMRGNYCYELFQQYYYYGANIFLHLNMWKSAFYFLRMVLSIPPMNKIHLASLKKCILTCWILGISDDHEYPKEVNETTIDGWTPLIYTDDIKIQILEQISPYISLYQDALLPLNTRSWMKSWKKQSEVFLKDGNLFLIHKCFQLLCTELIHKKIFTIACRLNMSLSTESRILSWTGLKRSTIIEYLKSNHSSDIILEQSSNIITCTRWIGQNKE